MFNNILLKVRVFRTALTVEPCLILYLIGMILSSLASQNLLMDKTCRGNLNYPGDLCDALISRDFEDNSTKEADTEVQRYVTQLNSMGKMLQLAFPFCMVLLWGAWSDRHSLRRPLMFTPMYAEVIKNLSLLLCVFFKQTTGEVVFMVENIFPLFGHWSVLVMGAFSHIMDSTDDKNRTMKVAITNILCILAEPVGIAISGVLLREIGYYGVFTLCTLFMFLGIILCDVLVKDITHDSEGPEITTVANRTPTKLNLFLDLFNFKQIKSILVVITRKRTDKKRTILHLCYLLIVLGTGPAYGQTSVNYFFTRHQFNYNEVQYSIYASVTSFLAITVLTIIMFLNSKIFHLPELFLAMLGLCFGIGSSISYGLCKVSRDFYIAGAIDSGTGVFTISLRATLMKLVEGHEAGKSNAIIGALEATTILIFATLYNFIYNLTLETFIGAYYFMSTICYVVSLIVTIAVYLVFKSVSLKGVKDAINEQPE